jgi:N-acetylglutamate synthase-like GNAT family acetyltransferase
MWLVSIFCSAESWRTDAKAFNALLTNYSAKTLTTKKMREDESRIMQFQFEDVSEAEAFIDACAALNGFQGLFESM